MKLWTWQKSGFDIADPAIPVDSKTNSLYWGILSRYPQTLQKLWDKLGTDQFHWYFTDEKQARSDASLSEHKGNVLWELDVPESQVLARICRRAWHGILRDNNACPPEVFEYLFDAFALNFPTIYDRECFSSDFNLIWSTMSSERLWDSLFPNCNIQQCYQILVRHPVDSSWVVKDPRKEVNWLKAKGEGKMS